MKLREYLAVTNQTQEEFSNKVDLSRRMISKYLNYQAFPNDIYLLKIEKATNGQVTRKDFYEQALEKINELIARNQIRLKMLCGVLGISEPALLKKLQGKTILAKWEFDAINSQVKEIIKNNKEKKHG